VGGGVDGDGGAGIDGMMRQSRQRIHRHRHPVAEYALYQAGCLSAHLAAGVAACASQAGRMGTGS
jgi:hypothetical protein